MAIDDCFVVVVTNFIRMFSVKGDVKLVPVNKKKLNSFLNNIRTLKEHKADEYRY